MRVVSLVIAPLLILTGGGCLVFWVSSGPRLAMEAGLVSAAFGLLPLIGGALLWRYAWTDRRDGGPP
jgi:hypothetical protein